MSLFCASSLEELMSKYKSITYRRIPHDWKQLDFCDRKKMLEYNVNKLVKDHFCSLFRISFDRQSNSLCWEPPKCVRSFYCNATVTWGYSLYEFLRIPIYNGDPTVHSFIEYILLERYLYY